MNSDSAVFDAIIAETAKKNIDILNDYGENDPFTETPEFEKMMDEVYAKIEKNIKKGSKKKKNLVRPVTVLAAALVLLLLFASLNVSAFKIFFYKTYLDIQGDMLNVETDTEGMLAQYAAISNFELKDELLVPGWLPKGTELVEINDRKDIVSLTYTYNSKNIYFEQNVNPDNIENLGEWYFLERSEYKFIENYVDDLSVYVGEIEGDTGKTMYIAIWRMDSISYTLKVYDSEVLLKAILSSLKNI